VFEVVGYAVNAYDTASNPDDKLTQMTVAWASLPVTALEKTTKHKLQLKGGTPFGVEDLFTEEGKQEKQGFFSKMFKQKEIVFERYITLETRQISQLPQATQNEICVLPPGLIVALPLVSFAAAFRSYCYRNLKDCATSMHLPSPNLAMSKFAAVYNNSDTLSVVAQCWPIIVAKKKVKEEIEEAMAKVVASVYSLMWEPWYRNNRSFPLRTLPAMSP